MVHMLDHNDQKLFGTSVTQQLSPVAMDTRSIEVVCFASKAECGRLQYQSVQVSFKLEISIFPYQIEALLTVLAALSAAIF